MVGRSVQKHLEQLPGQGGQMGWGGRPLGPESERAEPVPWKLQEKSLTQQR